MALDTGILRTRHEEAERKRKESAGKEFFNVQDGKNTVRVLPRSLKYFGEGKDDDFAVRYYVHYNLFDTDGFKMIVCNKTLGKTCPLCEEVYKLGDKVLIGKIKTKERFIYNVLDLSDCKIKIWETGPKIYDEILKFVLNPEWGDLFGLKDGRNITIEKIPAEKSGTGWVEYTIMPSPMPSDVTDSMPEGWDAEIDKLVEKLPLIHDETELKRLAVCFKTGTSPAQAEQLKRKEVLEERQSQPVLGTGRPTPVTPKEEKGKIAVPEDKKECFGEKYMPRAEKCKVCVAELRDACRTTYLSV